MSDSSLNNQRHILTNNKLTKHKNLIKFGNIAAKGYLGLIYTLLYLPIIVLVVMSFNKSKIGYN